jgi:hypothetical protein
MHISNRFVPCKIANGAKNPVLQVLQFQQTDFCHKFPGWRGKKLQTNESFLEVQLNVRALSLTFE